MGPRIPHSEPPTLLLTYLLGTVLTSAVHLPLHPSFLILSVVTPLPHKGTAAFLALLISQHRPLLLLSPEQTRPQASSQGTCLYFPSSYLPPLTLYSLHATGKSCCIKMYQHPKTTLPTTVLTSLLGRAFDDGSTFPQHLAVISSKSLPTCPAYSLSSAAAPTHHLRPGPTSSSESSLHPKLHPGKGGQS